MRPIFLPAHSSSLPQAKWTPGARGRSTDAGGACTGRPDRQAGRPAGAGRRNGHEQYVGVDPPTRSACAGAATALRRTVEAAEKHPRCRTRDGSQSTWVAQKLRDALTGWMSPIWTTMCSERRTGCGVGSSEFKWHRKRDCPGTREVEPAAPPGAAGMGQGQPGQRNAGQGDETAALNQVERFAQPD